VLLKEKRRLSVDLHGFKTENKVKCEEIYLHLKSLDSNNFKGPLPSLRRPSLIFSGEAIFEERESTV